MSHTRWLHTVVVTCLCGVALVARVADAAASSALQLDPTLLWAQTPSSPSPTDTRAAGGAASAEDLAKQLSNPIASLISVPFQSNVDFNAGQDNDQFKYTLNIQPVIPVSLSANWNLIALIIQPVLYQEELSPGVGSTFGMGDMNPSLFFSANEPFHGWIWGAGPVFLLPTATDEALGTGQWAVGLRFNVVLLFPR